MKAIAKSENKDQDDVVVIDKGMLDSQHEKLIGMVDATVCVDCSCPHFIDICGCPPPDDLCTCPPPDDLCTCPPPGNNCVTCPV